MSAPKLVPYANADVTFDFLSFRERCLEQGISGSVLERSYKKPRLEQMAEYVAV
jgi:hypothetical protein